MGAAPSSSRLERKARARLRIATTWCHAHQAPPCSRRRAVPERQPAGQRRGSPRCGEPRRLRPQVSAAANEVRESVCWLRLVERMGLSRSQRLPALIREGAELSAILKSSAIVLRAKRRGLAGGARLDAAPGRARRTAEARHHGHRVRFIEVPESDREGVVDGGPGPEVRAAVVGRGGRGEGFRDGLWHLRRVGLALLAVERRDADLDRPAFRAVRPGVPDEAVRSPVRGRSGGEQGRTVVQRDTPPVARRERRIEVGVHPEPRRQRRRRLAHAGSRARGQLRLARDRQPDESRGAQSSLEIAPKADFETPTASTAACAPSIRLFEG